MQCGSLALADAAAMEAFGEEVGRRAQPGLHLLLVGELGAGKTTLVRGIARGIGVTAPIASPTFSIVEDHGALVHVDWYRIEEERELDAIDFDSYLDGPSIVVVEWADKFPHRLDEDSLTLELVSERDGIRRVTARASQSVAALFEGLFAE